ncbi:GNAT family N-acetyltransferase [Streptoalloteichus hindustanus]|nr:GNAT family N-acetyltransferase [Streptoalloteichus hindustanus]
MDILWRPMRTADMSAWVELLAAVESVDRTGENTTREDLEEWISDPLVDLSTDTVLAYDGEILVASGVVTARVTDEGIHRIRVEGAVRPSHRDRGLGSELLQRLLARGEEMHRERRPDLPANVEVPCHEPNHRLASLLEQLGFRPIRRFYDMKRDLAQPVNEVAVPEGLRLVAYAPDLDEKVRLAHNAAFVDHWGNVAVDEELWKRARTGSYAFRPSLSYLLVAPNGEVAAYLLTHEYPADTEATGVRSAVVELLGTRREWRGRGAAAALLAHALAAYARSGFAQAALGVDVSNPTGALGLYRRCGFEVETSWVAYSRALPAVMTGETVQ